ncbi:hypothetical protein A3H66_02830 [Candidatus Falkowbacteria bacterium RIFCSPLOWO2_02_FULL_45_21]|uniref:[FeFe] hydrogenase H-cluster maturation GTPase HydF n=1 Tax=Candidatus Falkowbacteria bacterium RIFCSPLOWO2_02_FULL_45_21 TaxID=1797989 RepID=A0A1F5SDK8_9BACT|nr:MAG: hypothetical protein A3H66_02830 [Candidatus Falkowbacteria bacterium RIFCSPLOWO2_02_FULL_45_21]
MSKKVEFTIIAITGRMNAGKSSLFNLLSGQKNFAIVDLRPGTTADTVATRMEIHDFGPVKLLDTAGIDEGSILGEKKRKKTYEAIEEADLTLIVVDLLKYGQKNDFFPERAVARRAKHYGKQALMVYNIFKAGGIKPADLAALEKSANQKLNLGLKSLCLQATDFREQKKLVDFIKLNFQRKTADVNLLPLAYDRGYVLLNIPMDEETPSLRLLRPQDMAVERLLRQYLIPVLYRPDLKKARAGEAAEKQRFLGTIKLLQESKEGLKLVITDSQAVDILDRWLPKDISLTTFSVMMTNYMSGGNLKLFSRGLGALAKLKNGDRIVIMESCNHDRKCDDIGTKQIPGLIRVKLGLELNIDFSFGRPLPDDLKKYKLIVHCGGCMIDRQKYQRRIVKIKEAGVPITNYGLFLAWVHNHAAVARVVKIFK